MGSESSKRKAQSRCSVFNGSENEELEKLFKKISGNEETFNQKQFKEFLQPKLSEILSEGLYCYMKSVSYGKNEDQKKKSSPKDVRITKLHFSQTLATIFKGTNENKTTLLMFLINEAKLEPIKIVLKEILQLAELSLKSAKEYLSWKFQPEFADDQLIDHLLFDLVVRDKRQQCDVLGKLTSEKTFSSEDIEMWLSRMPMVVQLMDLAIHHCFPVGDYSQLMSHLLPHCDLGVDHSSPITALDFSSVLFLNSTLPPVMRSEWRLLFSSTLHGASFSTMLKKIVNEGPTVLVIKDRGGHIFGGFAAESWALKSNFYGSSHCFLFSLQPIMDVYLPTGYNSNFMYINNNQQTLPNGLGMGGQWNYAGLWVNDDFGSGHSKARPKCTTYNSPQLSSTQEFSFDIMEVWAVGRKLRSPEEEEEQMDQKKKSGLTKMDAETKAVFEMAGKQQHSEGMQETETEK